MINSFQKALAAARATHHEFRHTLHCWISLEGNGGLHGIAVLAHHDCEVQAKVVWTSPGPVKELMMLVDALNEKIGMEPVVVEAMKDKYLRSVNPAFLSDLPQRSDRSPLH